MIQKEELTKHFAKGKRKKKWTGWKPKTDEYTIEFSKRVVEKYDDKFDEDLVTFQKTIEIAAGEVAHQQRNEEKL